MPNGAKYWVFTLNNPGNNQHNVIPTLWKDVQYIVMQKEKGENGTVHLQGYVCFTKKKTLANLKKLDGRCHWEQRRGTHQEAKDYCQKEDTRIAGPWEHGDDKDIVDQKPGKRNDLLVVKQSIDEGKDDLYLVENYFETCAKHLRFFREYKRMKTTQRNYKTEVTVLWGPTGTGKSLFASQNYPNAYWKSKSNWWDGYDAHEVVVIDEFYGWLSYDFMLRLLDRYPLVLETKGGHTSFLAKKILITSNKHPRDWYEGVRNPYAPLERRIDKIIDYPLPIAPPSVVSLYCEEIMEEEPSDMPEIIEEIRKEIQMEKDKDKGKEREVPFPEQLPIRQKKKEKMKKRRYSPITLVSPNISANVGCSTSRPRTRSVARTEGAPVLNTEWDTDEKEEDFPAILRTKKQRSRSRLSPKAGPIVSPDSPYIHPNISYQDEFVDVSLEDLELSDFDKSMQKAYNEWKSQK